MHRLLLLLSVPFLLTGCGRGTMPIVETPSPVLTVPGVLLNPGPASLPQVTDLTPRNLFLNHVRTAEEYHGCRNKLLGWIEWYNGLQEVLELDEE